jgi:hypothetical protein
MDYKTPWTSGIESKGAAQSAPFSFGLLPVTAASDRAESGLR